MILLPYIYSQPLRHTTAGNAWWKGGQEATIHRLEASMSKVANDSPTQRMDIIKEVIFYMTGQWGAGGIPQFYSLLVLYRLLYLRKRELP